MSLAQNHEADLLRHQLASLRVACDIVIGAAKEERDRAVKRADDAKTNFHHCIYIAALGWVLFSVLAVASALHYGMYHSSSSTPGAAATTAAPSFSR